MSLPGRPPRSTSSFCARYSKIDRVGAVHHRHSLVWLVLLCLASAGCATMPRAPEGGSPPASQALGRDDITQLAELLRLEDRRDFDASRFQQLFRHPTPLI
ncbi:MAG: hypothetical protein HY703_02145, partial [Gemmatimonadetes bacterium]|nr:hypothetical protein [Gemmatimonadota bacterium]